MIPELSSHDQSQYELFLSMAMTEAEPSATIKRGAYVDSTTNELIATGLSHPEARKAAEKRCHVSGNAVLDENDRIQFQTSGTVPVRAILVDPAQYHGQPCADPLEPEEGTNRAKLYVNQDGSIIINSQLHGGQKYFLRRSEAAIDIVGLKQERAALPIQQAFHRFRFISAGEMVREICPTEWLITGILETQALSVMFGDPGTYKSFAALSMALSIATGSPWYGRPVKQGPVVIVIGEGKNGYAKRMQAWSNVTGVDLKNAAMVVSTAPAQILDSFFCDHLIRLIEELKTKHGAPALFILDTLARNFGAGDENSTGDMSKFISNLDKTMGNNCHRLIVHHSGHTEKDRGRGSSALKGAVDAEMMLKKSGELVHMTCGKMKDAPPFEKMLFKPVIVGVETIDPLQPDTSIYLEETLVAGAPVVEKRLSASAILALNSLEGIIGNRDCIHLEEWRQEFYSRSTSDTIEAKKKAFLRARNELAIAAKIDCRDDYYSPIRERELNGTNRDNVPSRPGPDRDKAGLSRLSKKRLKSDHPNNFCFLKPPLRATDRR